MDDVNTGGPEDLVAKDIELIKQRGEEIGLHLNNTKCEFINHTGISNDSIFQHFIHHVVRDASQLGAPITIGPAMDDALETRCAELTRVAERLHFVSSHDALVLLRASFSAPKLLHTLRSSPCAGHPTLMKFDDLLRQCVCNIANADLTDFQWIQASLPVRNGGLGIRRVASLAPSAFLASAAATHDLQDEILSRCQAIDDSAVSQILLMWTTEHGASRPANEDAAKQRIWDKASVDPDVAKLKSSLIRQDFSQYQHPTTVTGSTPCQSQHADYASTMKLSGSRLDYG